MGTRAIVTPRTLGLAVAVLAACDGSDGIGSPTPLTLNLAAEAALDGWVSSSGAVDLSGGLPVVGDLDAVSGGLHKRQFVSFGIDTIPDGAQIYSAALQLDQCAVAGTPFPTLGNVVVDHVVYGDTLTATDYDAPAELAAVGVLAADATTGVKEVAVTGRLQADLNAGRSHNQFRLRFTLLDGDDDGANDFAAFRDVEGSNCAGSPPRLVVVYVIP